VILQGAKGVLDCKGVQLSVDSEIFLSRVVKKTGCSLLTQFYNTEFTMLWFCDFACLKPIAN